MLFNKKKYINPREMEIKLMLKHVLHVFFCIINFKAILLIDNLYNRVVIFYVFI